MDMMGAWLKKKLESKQRPAATEKHALADEIWQHFKLSDKGEYQMLLGMIRNVGIESMRQALKECKTRKMPYPYLKGIYKRVYQETWKEK